MTNIHCILRFILDIHHANTGMHGQCTSLSLQYLNFNIKSEAGGSQWIASFGGPIYSAFGDTGNDYDAPENTTAMISASENIGTHYAGSTFTNCHPVEDRAQVSPSARTNWDIN